MNMNPDVRNPNLDLAMAQRWDALVRDESLSFQDIRERLGKEFGFEFDDIRDGARVMNRARIFGRISYEIDGTFMSISRAALEGSKVDRKELFVEAMRKKAEHEDKDIDKAFEKLGELAWLSRHLMLRQKHGETLKPEEEQILKDFSVAQHAVTIASYRSPARFLMHFYDNGDLKFIWGLNDQQTYYQVSFNTGSGRLGDAQDVEW